MQQIIYILNYIDTAAPLLTLFFFITPFKKLTKELRFIFWFVCVQFVTNLISSSFEIIYNWSDHSIVWNNYSVYALNIVLSFGILSALLFLKFVKAGERSGIALGLAASALLFYNPETGISVSIGLAFRHNSRQPVFGAGVGRKSRLVR